MDAQDLCERLADGLRRSAVLLDERGRVSAVALRSSSDAARLWMRPDIRPLEALEAWLATSQRPDAHRIGIIRPGAADSDAWSTLPLRSDGALLGWLALAGEEEPAAGDLALVDIAACMIGDGRVPETASSPRRRTVRDLLDPDPRVRRAALVRASARRWVERGDHPRVHAVLLPDRLGVLAQLREAARLARAAGGGIEVIRERDDAVFLLDRGDGDAAARDQGLRQAAREQGVELLATGSAAIRPDDEDLARAAHAAMTAAELSLAVPELADATDADSLGGWTLLHAVRAHRDLLAVASPAAEVLCALGPVARDTVETYLDAAGQARETCNRLHIHRTTLYYRLDNLPDVVKEALADGMQRSTLHLSLKLDRLWAATATESR